VRRVTVSSVVGFNETIPNAIIFPVITFSMAASRQMMLRMAIFLVVADAPPVVAASHTILPDLHRALHPSKPHHNVLKNGVKNVPRPSLQRVYRRRQWQQPAIVQR
jgi:hypothetical protein